jgi:hypothetical protein
MKIGTFYDTLGDILYLDFPKTRQINRGITIADDIILRVDPDTLTPTKLVIHNYTRLVAEHLGGRTDFPLNQSIRPEFRAAVLRALKSAPLNQFLELRGTAKRPRLALALALLPQIAQAA